MSVVVAAERGASGANDTSAHGVAVDNDEEGDEDDDEHEADSEMSASARASSSHGTRRCVSDGIANNARKVSLLAS